jgi:hypothetical protein
MLPAFSPLHCRWVSGIIVTGKIGQDVKCRLSISGRAQSSSAQLVLQIEQTFLLFRFRGSIGVH